MTNNSSGSGAITPPASSGARPSSLQSAGEASAIVLEHVSFAFDEQVVLEDVSFSVPKGSMRFLLGASGSGKSVLLKLILGLFRPDSGSITVNGHRIDQLPERELLRVRSDMGMVFQDYALFSSFNVGENVGYRLYEETDMPLADVQKRVEEVLGYVGLTGFAERMPSELSGGQRRRVALARAIATRPSLLLFDDPTTGLDPIISAAVDDEIVKLRDLEHVTSVVATHQMRDAFYIAQHEATASPDGIRITPASDGALASSAEFMVLHEGRISFQGSAADLLAAKDPYLKEFMFKTLPPW